MAVMRRLVPTLTAALLAVAPVAGCASTTDGVAKANPAHTAKPLGSVDLDSIFLTPSQLSEIVGAPLALRLDQNRPAGGGSGGPCSPVDTAGADSFVGNGFQAFHVLVLADGKGEEHDHVVTQSAAVYPDAPAAGKQFASVTGGLAPCDGRQLRGDAAWKFAINDVTPESVRWNKEQTDVSLLWVCYGQGRVRNNVIVEAMVCRGDDAGAQNVDTILDRMSAAIWELSGA